MKIGDLKKSLNDKVPNVIIEENNTTVPVTEQSWRTIAQEMGIASGLQSMCQFLGELSNAGVSIRDDGRTHYATFSDLAFAMVVPELMDAE